MNEERTVNDDMDFIEDLGDYIIEVRNQLLWGYGLSDDLSAIDTYKYLSRIDYVNKRQYFDPAPIETLNAEFEYYWKDYNDNLTEAEAIKKIYKEFTAREERKDAKTFSSLVMRFTYSTMYEFDDGSYMTLGDISSVYSDEYKAIQEEEREAKETEELWKDYDNENK